MPKTHEMPPDDAVPKKPASVLAQILIKRSSLIEGWAEGEMGRMKSLDPAIALHGTDGKTQYPEKLHRRSKAIKTALIILRGRLAELAIQRSRSLSLSKQETKLISAQKSRLDSLEKEIDYIGTFTQNLD